MAKIDVIEELAARFMQPLPAFMERRVVVWHDPDGEFAPAFAELAEHGFDTTLSERLPRPVRCVEAVDGHMFEAKRLINREDTASDILLYRRQARGSLEGDWLADVELYADQFQADYLSLLADQLGASDPDAVREVLAAHRSFFAAKGRVNKFSKCMPEPSCAADVELGMLASMFGGTTPAAATMPFVVRACCTMLLHDGPEELATLLDRYEAGTTLADFVKQRCGFAGPLTDRDSLTAFASHLLLTAASAVLPSDALSGLMSHVSPSYAPFCMTVVREWCWDATARNDLREVAELVEDACGLRGVFSKFSLGTLLPLDVFPCVDEVILGGLFDSLAHGADRVDEVHRALQTRRDLCWFEDVACYYDVLVALADMVAFKRDHAGGFHIGEAAEVWEAYTQDWWHMDAAYRALRVADERCKLAGVESLESSERAAVDTAENMYSNWFLSESNACWANAAQAMWHDAGYVEDVARQDMFYWETLPTFTGDAKTKVVLVSDALRYEVAQDVATALERERGGSVRMGSMQAVFPSITEMGMPALLPHNSLTLDLDKDAVLADGKPTGTTHEREAVLRAAAPTARALRAQTYLDLAAADRKALLKDSELVYLYHNKIDATGEKFATESDVFDACAETVDELVSIAKRLCMDAPGARVVITADHGFLYTARELAECHFLGKDDIPDDPVLFGKRHAVLAADDSLAALFDGPDAGPYLPVNMDRFSTKPCVGLATRGIVHFKRPGGTVRYVHGGVSLQELVVPVIGYRRLTASAKGFEDTQAANVRVLDESRRVTNSLFGVKLIQDEPAVGKVLPCDYELVFVDSYGNEVSDAVRLHADLTSANPQDRVCEARFALKVGTKFSSAESYQLLCRDAQSGQIVWREPYQINVSFAPVVDFGF